MTGVVSATELSVGEASVLIDHILIPLLDNVFFLFQDKEMANEAS